MLVINNKISITGRRVGKPRKLIESYKRMIDENPEYALEIIQKHKWYLIRKQSIVYVMIMKHLRSKQMEVGKVDLTTDLERKQALRLSLGPLNKHFTTYFINEFKKFYGLHKTIDTILGFSTISKRHLKAALYLDYQITLSLCQKHNIKQYFNNDFEKLKKELKNANQHQSST